MTRIGLALFGGFLAACSPSASYTVAGDEVLSPLSTAKPNKENGAILFSTRSDAHCVLCHSHDALDVPFQGDLGPDLTDVRKRLNAAQIRLRIVDYDIVKPGTTMPSYYRTQGLHQVLTEHKGETVLTGEQIEDIIAFLIHDSH